MKEVNSTAIFTKGKDATNAAIFKMRSGIKNHKALQSLGAFASEIGLFNHTEDSDSEWDNYETRCRIEKAADDINTQSIAEQQKPKDIFRNNHLDRISLKAQEAQKALPNLRVRFNPDEAANVADPASIDYRNPNDFCRTQLINATIDRDMHKVKFLVEQKRANLFVRDQEGSNAFVTALDYGHMEIANYLQNQMQASAQQDINTQTKIA